MIATFNPPLTGEDLQGQRLKVLAVATARPDRTFFLVVIGDPDGWKQDPVNAQWLRFEDVRVDL